MMEGSQGDDMEGLDDAMLQARPQIKAVGCGGAGCNTISHLMEEMEEGEPEVETFAVNTDAQDLLHANADEKILIGREVTGGLGAGNDPEKGMKAAREDKVLLRDALSDSDMVFITCGLGGGTGTGAGPVIAEVAKEVDSLAIGVLTLPFRVEGERRARNAQVGLDRFREKLDSTIFIPDDKLLEISPNLSLVEAFKLADSLLADLIGGIIDLVMKPGLVNLDFADIETVLLDGGLTMIGIGESDLENRAEKAAREALSNPLLEVDISKVNKALINIIGSPNMSIEEAEEISEIISDALSDNPQVIWGAQTDESMRETIKVMIAVPGVEYPEVENILETRETSAAREALEELEYISRS